MNKEAFTQGYVDQLAKLADHKEDHLAFLNHFGPPITDINNPESTWYSKHPSKVPQINDIAELYAKRKAIDGIKTPGDFISFVTTQGANFATNWNKQHKLNYENGGMDEEMYKYRDLRHFTPKQWKAFKSHLNKTRYSEL